MNHFILPHFSLFLKQVSRVMKQFMTLEKEDCEQGDNFVFLLITSIEAKYVVVLMKRMSVRQKTNKQKNIPLTM